MTERVARLEARTEERERMVDDVRQALANFEQRVDRRFEAVDRRFEAIDRRFDNVDQRFEAMNTKISRHFYWIVGLQITTLTAILAALAAR
jgi:hypothetical protein